MNVAPTAPDDRARAHFVRSQLPAQGLFHGHEWRIATGPFQLDAGVAGQLEFLGRVLLQFNRAANRLYRLSAEGKQPGWIAALLDQGKPAELIALQRNEVFKNEVPRVIRPDLLLTEEGLRITELDSIPGGIGLTAWLNQTYATHGPVLGGAAGMLRGFESIFGEARDVRIIVSDESAVYRPEMKWLAQQLGPRFSVAGPSPAALSEGTAVYRFFELFDVENVPVAAELFRLSANRQLWMTPTPKPLFEEKLLLALLWNRNLREFWRQELGGAFFGKLLEWVPQTWVVDPTPLPPHAALPDLNLTDWRQLASLSQRDRALVLKPSGFSAEAWGARGVSIGNDLSAEAWAAAVEKAIGRFESSPHVLQRFQRTKVFEAQYFDFESDQAVSMAGRVRLSPYYFVRGDGDQARAVLGGALATICPSDKKVLHGMPEAILAPCAAG